MAKRLRSTDPQEKPSASKGLVRAIITPQNLVLLDASAAKLLEPLLTYASFDFEHGDPYGHRRKRREVEVYTVDHRGRLAFPAGLLPRCKAVLESKGYRVEVEDARKLSPRLQGQEGVLLDLASEERMFLEAVAREPLGQVEVHGFWDTVRKIILIRRFFPRARLAVAVATRRQLHNYWYALEEALGERVGLYCGGHDRGGRRCVVCTHQSLTELAPHADILLLPDAAGAAGDDAAMSVVMAAIPRVYAFVPPAGRQDHRTRIRLEAMAGTVIHALEPPRARVHVLMVRTPRCAEVGMCDTALERKRKAYWNNKPRNKLVAKVVRALVKKDKKTPGALGLFSHDLVAKNVFRANRIAVLVESVEHAHHLELLLPGAVVHDAVPRQSEAGPIATDTPRVQIVTVMAAAKEEIKADILVRATGGASALHVFGFPPAKMEHVQDHRLYVIDIDDAFDRIAVNDTAARLSDYEMREFEVSRAGK